MTDCEKEEFWNALNRLYETAVEHTRQLERTPRTYGRSCVSRKCTAAGSRVSKSLRRDKGSLREE
jgi:hypothetical protein